MRKRFMRENKRTSIPHNLAFVDSETWWSEPGEGSIHRLHQFRLGVAIGCRMEGGEETRRDVCRFRTTDEFWTWLMGRMQGRDPLWLFAHNLAFDLPILKVLDRIESGELVFPRQKPAKPGEANDGKRPWFDGCYACIEDLPTIFKCEAPGRGKLVIVDTLNYFRMPLAKLAGRVGMVKYGMPDEYAPDEVWEAYCENDTEIIERTMVSLLKFWEKADFGNFRFTAAGLAMSAYKHRYMKHPIAYHFNDECKAHERNGYYGGQLSAYRLGVFQERVYELDVNGLYPFVMRNEKFPCDLVSYWGADETASGRPYEPYNELIADVDIETEWRTYPVRHEGHTQYAVGKFRTTLCGPELVDAVKYGNVVKWHKWSRYKLADLFSAYVDAMGQFRRAAQLAGDDAMDEFAKLLSTSLSGKMAQWEHEWIHTDEVLPKDKWHKWTVCDNVNHRTRTFRTIGWNVQELLPEREKDDSFPAISAFITSYGRKYMQMLRTVAGWSNVYYQAVDALHVTQYGFDRLEAAGFIHATELGKLKIKSEADEGHYYGVNRWRLAGRVVHGGVKRDAKQNKDGDWVFETYEGLPKICSRPPDGLVRTFIRTIEFKEQNLRGRIGQDGWVCPLLLVPPERPEDMIDPATVVSAMERSNAMFRRS